MQSFFKIDLLISDIDGIHLYTMNNPYAILGVPEGASKEQINNAYRNLARQYSEQGNTAALDELNRAYDAVIMTAGSSGSYTRYEQAYQNDFSFIRLCSTRLRPG